MGSDRRHVSRLARRWRAANPTEKLRIVNAIATSFLGEGYGRYADTDYPGMASRGRRRKAKLLHPIDVRGQGSTSLSVVML
jgi:hypothetical protein